ncbi:RNA methyltransferase [Actinopolymorpha sp. B9G3]|uniref:TrmH family RNA methyltransferase n=1 Tax=Actinopolymorpha sp. B9G3 TaxID=3158970 RepID=UPI0032D95D9F
MKAVTPPHTSPVVGIDTLDDPRLRDYANLRDVSLRKSLEAAEGIFIAEGEKVIRRAIEAGYPVRSFLMSERWVDGLRDAIPPGVPCYVAPPADLARVTGFQVHRGALASMARVPLPPVGEVVSGASRILVLEDIVDHTNVGAIFRGAAAFGIEAIVLAPRCADPLYRRSVKVSMGAVFSVPYARMSTWYDGLGALRQLGFDVIALTPAADAEPLPRVVRRSRRPALVLGTEGDGLSARWEGQADVRARIPISPAVDSLNVAAAAAVACYLLTSQD